MSIKNKKVASRLADSILKTRGKIEKAEKAKYRDEYATPPWFLEALLDYAHRTIMEREHQYGRPVDFFGKRPVIDLDPCASRYNHKAPVYFTKKDDGLVQSWDKVKMLDSTGKYFSPKCIYVNPPYSNIPPFVDKCIKESRTSRARKSKRIILLLVNADSSTEWFAKAKEHALVTLLIRPRVSFDLPDHIQDVLDVTGSNLRGSVLFIFGDPTVLTYERPESSGEIDLIDLSDKAPKRPRGKRK